MTRETSGLPRAFGVLLVIFIIFNVIFPKGGMKIGDAPLTNGYIVTALIFTFGFLHAVATGRVRSWEMMVLGLMLPFQTWVLFTYREFGLDPVTGSYGIGQLIIFIALPYLILVGGGFILRYADMTAPAKWFVWGLRTVAVFGIVQFFYFYVTKEFIEIPFLIVNLADLGDLGDKYNMRGEFSKLISTYNNGNIYAVCLCMMAPLYLLLEKRGWWKIVVLTSMFLTLSRTGWIGLILVLAFEFHRMRWGVKKGLAALAGIATIMVVPVMAPEWFGLNEDFFTDAELGGRAAYLRDMWEIGFLPNHPLGEFKEVIYFSVAWTYGISGLILFLAFVSAPLAVAWLHGAYALPASRRILAGLAIYLVLCGSDGAMLFPPTMTIFYFLASAALTHAFDRVPGSVPVARPTAPRVRPRPSEPVGGGLRGGLVSAMVMQQRRAATPGE